VAWPNPHSRVYGFKEIGKTTMGTKGNDDSSTLKSKKFVIGDFLDVAINIPRVRENNRDGAKVARTNSDNRRAYRDYR